MKGRLFVIGASLSGIDALCELVSRLPANFPAPIFIAQHVASHSPGMLPQLLTHAGKLPALHPKTATLFESGKIYVAPPDRHMLVMRKYIRLSHGPQENLARPAIDPLFRSAAAAYGPAVVGVILTGQLNDGTAGLLAIKDCGGFTIVQDPLEATAASMPRSAIGHMNVDRVCTLAEMADLFVQLANDDPPAEEQERITRLMEIENRIAEGIFSVEDWWNLEQMSAPSGLNCPNCRSALYEMSDKRVLRFRCRSGHGFTAESLLSGQAEAREAHLSALFGALVEEVGHAKRLQQAISVASSPELQSELLSRIGELERQAGQVCEWLHSMANLVEPEPS